MTDVYDLLEAEWNDSDIGPDRLAEEHGYTLGDDSTPSFPRVEKFLASEPLRDIVFEGPLPKFLGYDDEGNVLSENAMPELTESNHRRMNAPLSPRRPSQDKWKEWHRARAKLLFGGNRSHVPSKEGSFAQYVAFPEDELVNRAIISTALKEFGVGGGSGMFESDHVRDLCAHLAEVGVHRNDDGSFDIRFLKQEATKYIRRNYNAVSVNAYLMKNTTNKGTQDA